MGVRQKSGIGRGDRLGLVFLFAVTAIIILLNAYQISHLNATREEYAETHSHTNAAYDSLDALFQDYVSTHSHTNVEYDALFAAYQTYISTYNHSSHEYASLLAAYDAYVSTHNYTNTAYDWLESERDELENIVDLAKSTMWIDNETVSQPAKSYSEWTFVTQYAGYVTVNVETSTTEKTYVQVVYSAYGVEYDETVDVGEGDTAVFPVLPTDALQVRVGNTDKGPGATETVTVTYHY